MSPTQATHGPYTQSLANKYKISFDESYARRTIELSKWFSNVFGEQEINFKIRVILSAQQAYNGRSDNHLNFIKKLLESLINSFMPQVHHFILDQQKLHQ